MRVEGLAVARRDAEPSRFRLRIALLLQSDSPAGPSSRTARRTTRPVIRAGRAMISTRCPTGSRTNDRCAPQCSGRGRGGNPGALQPGQRRLVVLRDHRDMPLPRHDGLVGEQQVDLRRAGLHPARALAQRPRRLDLREAEQRPERDARALSVSRTSRATCWTLTASPLDVLLVDALLSRAAPRERQWRPAAPRGTRRPRAGSPRARAPSITAPWPGTTCSACSTSVSRRRSVARYASREPVLGEPSGSRPARGSRRDEHPAHGIQIAMPSAVCPSVGCSSSSSSPTSSVPGHRQRLDLAERQRPLALDVVLVVERAQLALGRPGLGGQPRGGRLRAAERRAGEREAAEQVVPVAVRDEQPAEANCACCSSVGSSSSSSG